MRMYFRLLDQSAPQVLLIMPVTLTDLHLCREAQRQVVRQLLHLVDDLNASRHRRKLTRGKAALHDAYVTLPMMMAS